MKYKVLLITSLYLIAVTAVLVGYVNIKITN